MILISSTLSPRPEPPPPPPPTTNVCMSMHISLCLCVSEFVHPLGTLFSSRSLPNTLTEVHAPFFRIGRCHISYTVLALDVPRRLTVPVAHVPLSLSLATCACPLQNGGGGGGIGTEIKPEFHGADHGLPHRGAAVTTTRHEKGSFVEHQMCRSNQRPSRSRT